MRLFVLALVACAATLATCDKISERDGYLYQHRQRLGHFKEQPFIDLYHTYAAAFVLPLHPERSHDDYRNYVPSGEECINYFQQFRANKYQVSQIDEFILLDGCLGYLYESEYHEFDKSESQHVQQRLPALLQDEKLKELYEQTQIATVSSAESKTCVANLLMNSVIMRRQYSDQRCNSDWIQLFLQFAECQTENLKELRQNDSYLKAIYTKVRDETQYCFNAEKLALEQAVRQYYSSAVGTRVKNSLLNHLGKRNLNKQQGERMWPSSVMNLLRVVQDAQQEVSLRQVHKLLRGYYLEDPKLKQLLLDNLAKYAKKVINPKSKDKNGDPTGAQRYQDKVVNQLCNPFRSSDSKRGYDFATTIIRMVRLLSHEDVFEISFKKFIETLLTHAEESASMYLCVSACNIITFTDGFVKLPVHGKQVDFVVEPKSDTTDMVRWPDAGFY